MFMERLSSAGQVGNAQARRKPARRAAQSIALLAEHEAEGGTRGSRTRLCRGAGRIAPRPCISERVLGYRQFQVLAFVTATIDSEGQAPTYGMIQQALAFCDRAGVVRVVDRLERRGLLSRVGAGRVRRIRLG